MKESFKKFSKVEDDNTIFNYLASYQLELSDEKAGLEAKLKSIKSQLEIAKNSYNSECVEESTNYNLFSPISEEKNSFSDQVYEDMNQLTIEYSKYENRYQHVKDGLVHLQEITKWCKEKSCNNTTNSYLLNISDINNIEDFRLKLLENQEMERKRIAKDLHDNTVQNLTNIIHKTELCSKLVDIDNIRVKLELQTMMGTIKTTIRDMRSIIYNLMPMSIDDLGIEVSIQQYLNQIKEVSNINLKTKIDIRDIKIPSIINVTLFRIIQESCNNVLKHAKATEITISLYNDESNIYLSIIDNGIGFNVKEKINDASSKGSNFGLFILNERVSLLSGQISIESKENSGTKISVKVPINSFMEENDDTN